MLFAATAGAVAAVAPAAHAAKTVKPCLLATPGQVKLVMGVDVDPGTTSSLPGPSGTKVQQCQFTAKGTPGAVTIIQIVSGKFAATSFDQGMKSLPYTPISSLGVKAYQVKANDSIGFLYKDFYVIVQPPGKFDDARDVSKMPDLAKIVLSSLKAHS
jgi:hypothetical protein